MIKIINTFIKENKKDVRRFLLIFFIGLVIGIIFLNISNSESKKNLSNYIHTYINNLKSLENFKYIYKEGNILKNSYFLIILFMSGFFIFGKVIVYIVNLMKGIILGYTISSIVGSFGFGKGIVVALSTLLIQNLIEIPIIIFASIVSVYMIKYIKSINNKEDFRKKVIIYLIIYLFTECINITSLLINVYFSSNFVKIVKLF